MSTVSSGAQVWIRSTTWLEKELQPFHLHSFPSLKWPCFPIKRYIFIEYLHVQSCPWQITLAKAISSCKESMGRKTWAHPSLRLHPIPNQAPGVLQHGVLMGNLQSGVGRSFEKTILIWFGGGQMCGCHEKSENKISSIMGRTSFALQKYFRKLERWAGHRK